MTPFSHIKDYTERKAAMGIMYRHWINHSKEELLSSIQLTFREAAIRSAVSSHRLTERT